MNDTRPTDEQIRACLAEWLMLGPDFTNRQRRDAVKRYADGYGNFGEHGLAVITYLWGGTGRWRVPEKGLAFLAGEINLGE